ncbi:MAG: T9SS type A sorting domain-containing protein, partial [Bacteroidota bacterium]|nr:T9SS type A sorting domain-containing protein [Bacteroidota bacterium]
VNDGKMHNFSWEIETDETVKKQVLEVSENGKYFQTVTEASDITREFSYTPTTNSVLQYRLKVLFENGKQLYSNTIALKSNLSTAKPTLYSNIINSNTLIINAPSQFNYIIYDFSGRIINRGNLKQGSTTINTSIINSGTYIIHFSNSESTFVEKFVKQ